ncbi:DUF2809 domain-containing protein [uncultured Marixanthomonas sp.]|uniref:ribosomal maturation YjgA family protein n=1 Tax=uncultured Marixanthomonas sp. TaxID=757245 RepID=UPI0030D9AA8F|tara:strand:+ start:52396 stop:52788 length:393 start_codon:yes stop_codon:yes gene_type:complete
MKLRFNKTYFILFALLLLIETLIALFGSNTIIRGFVGDVLVVILLFAFIKTLFNITSKKVLIAILLFAFGVEFLQYFEITKRLHIQSKFIKIIMGTTFDFTDFAAYFLGFLASGFLDKLFQKKKSKTFKN